MIDPVRQRPTPTTTAPKAAAAGEFGSLLSLLGTAEPAPRPRAEQRPHDDARRDTPDLAHHRLQRRARGDDHVRDDVAARPIDRPQRRPRPSVAENGRNDQPSVRPPDAAPREPAATRPTGAASTTTDTATGRAGEGEELTVAGAMLAAGDVAQAEQAAAAQVATAALVGVDLHATPGALDVRVDDAVGGVVDPVPGEVLPVVPVSAAPDGTATADPTVETGEALASAHVPTAPVATEQGDAAAGAAGGVTEARAPAGPGDTTVAAAGPTAHGDAAMADGSDGGRPQDGRAGEHAPQPRVDLGAAPGAMPPPVAAPTVTTPAATTAGATSAERGIAATDAATSAAGAATTTATTRPAHATTVLPTAAAQVAERVVRAADDLRTAPPPRLVTLEFGELGDLRVQVRMVDGQVTFQTQGPAGVDLRALDRELEQALSERGFDLGGDARRPGRGPADDARDGGEERPGAAPVLPEVGDARPVGRVIGSRRATTASASGTWL